MTKTLLGRAFAAMLMFGTATAAQAGGYYQGASGAASPSTALPYGSNLLYRFDGSFPNSNTNLTSGRIYCTPGSVRSSVYPATLAVKISTAAANGHVKLAIYSDTTTNTNRSGQHSPALPLAATGDIATDSTTVAATPTAGQGPLTATLSTPLTPGTVYWKCMMADATAQTTAQFVATGSISTIQTTGDASLVNAATSATAGYSGLTSSAVATYANAFPDLSSAAMNVSTATLPDVFFVAP